MNKIAVIIPVLNEVQYIGTLLQHLCNSTKHPESLEIIVVDGGSTDGTIALLNKMSSKVNLNSSESINIKVLNSKKGRAKQMNLGAQKAEGDILYFLHADSFPPLYFDDYILSEVKKEHLAGCFRMQFDSKHWWLRLASWFTQFSWRACRGGDQSQFITRPLFNEIGGYDEDYTIYEDNILINALYARKQFVVINKTIRTSARLYKKHGIWKLQYHFWTIYVKKWFGASADELYSYYKKHISK